MANLRLFLLLVLSLLAVRADLLDCEEQPKLPDLLEVSDIGPKITAVVTAIQEELPLSSSSSSSSSSASSRTSEDEHEVRDFFKNVGCQIKKGATKVTEQAKKLGVEIKEGAKKLSEKAKDLGSDIKIRFEDFREKLAKDSVEEMTSRDRGFLANVEIINPDILKGEQQCGHGHILDALGNCSKLRK